MNPPSTLTDADRAYIRRIVSTAPLPLWKVIVGMSPLTLMFLAVGIVIRWLPSSYEARGIALSARHYSVWIPIGEGTEEFRRFCTHVSGVIFIETAIMALLFWGLLMQGRRQRELLAKAFPAGETMPTHANPSA